MAFVYQRTNGQRLATRVDGTLYYVHSDLLGSTVAVSNDTGQAMGWVQYAPYGEVLTSTLPVTLTDRLWRGQPLDASTELVYQGGGQYYDPYIGRALQPDPFGGVPQLPQTLNRYGVPRGVLSPSGLGRQTGYGGGFPWAALGKSTLSESVSAVIAQKWVGPGAEWLVRKAAWRWLSIEVVSRHPKHHIRRPLKNLVGSTVANRLAKGHLDEWSGVVRLSDDYLGEWAGRLIGRGVSVQMSSARGIWSFGLKPYLTVGNIVPGMGADLLVGGLWQLGEDIITYPELLDDPGLLTRRAAAGGLYNVSTGLMGMGIAGGAAWVIGIAFGVTVGAPIILVEGVVVTIGIEVFWGEQIEGWWFERFNARAPWE